MLQLASASLLQQCSRTAPSLMQFRSIGTDKMPEFWGRPSAYTEGTSFLGTPKNHLDLADKRPLSPDVLDIDNRSPHYKFPMIAISSVLNRITGVILTGGFTGAGIIAMNGDLPGLISSLADSSPLITFPLKFALAYTVLYHYLGGLRHFAWDHFSVGNNIDSDSLLELNKADLASKAMLGGTTVLSLVLAFL